MVYEKRAGADYMTNVNDRVNGLYPALIELRQQAGSYADFLNRCIANNNKLPQSETEPPPISNDAAHLISAELDILNRELWGSKPIPEHLFSTLNSQMKKAEAAYTLSFKGPRPLDSGRTFASLLSSYTAISIWADKTVLYLAFLRGATGPP